MNRRLLIKALLPGVSSILLASAAPGRVPQAVSPGFPGRIAIVRSDCPTFNWTQIPEALRYDLVVVPLPTDPEPPLGIEPGDLFAKGILYEEIPGGATGWTPDLSRCLAPDGRYVWFVRAVVENDNHLEIGDWSTGRLFRVAATGEVAARTRTLHREPGPDGALADQSSAPGAVDSVPIGPSQSEPTSIGEYQGYLTGGDGVPFQGSHDLELRLWDRATGGTMVWGPQTVTDVMFVEGRYEVQLHGLELSSGKSFFLEVAIGGQAFSPRQQISHDSPLTRPPIGVAREEPGPAAPDPLFGLYVDHAAEVDARGAYFRGDDYGIYVEEIGDGEVALYSPDFIWAAGYRSSGSTYLWVPGNAGVLYPKTGCDAYSQWHGSVRIECSSSGTVAVNIPIVLPGVLLGQNVEVTAVRIYYDLDSADSYIDLTALRKQTETGQSVELVESSVDRKSTTPTSYSLSVADNGALDSSSGILNLYLGMLHDGSTFHDIKIGGVRVTLKHTP